MSPCSSPSPSVPLCHSPVGIHWRTVWPTEVLRALVYTGVLAPADFLAVSVASTDVVGEARPLRAELIKVTCVLGYLPDAVPTTPTNTGLSAAQLVFGQPPVPRWTPSGFPAIPPPPPPSA